MPPLWDENDCSVFGPPLRSNFRLPAGAGLSEVEATNSELFEEAL